jgi:hypothetical protein
MSASLPQKPSKMSSIKVALFVGRSPSSSDQWLRRSGAQPSHVVGEGTAIRTVAPSLIGKSGVVPAPESPSRWLVQFSEFARLDIPEVWQKGRFPLAYADISEILPGVDLTALEWERMPPPAEPFPVIPPESQATFDGEDQTADLSDLPEVVACRTRLAAELGIAPDKLGMTAEVLGGRLRFASDVSVDAYQNVAGSSIPRIE